MSCFGLELLSNRPTSSSSLNTPEVEMNNQAQTATRTRTGLGVFWASLPRRRRTSESIKRFRMILSFGFLLLIRNPVIAGDPGEVFIKNCAACHGEDGKGETLTGQKLGIKDLSKSKLTEVQIEQQILEGKPAGQGTAKMPAFKARLTHQEIKSLVSVVKAFRD